MPNPISENQFCVLHFLARRNQNVDGAPTIAEISQRHAALSKVHVRSAINALLKEDLVEPLGTGPLNAQCYGITDTGRARWAEINEVREAENKARVSETMRRMREAAVQRDNDGSKV